MFFPRIRLQCGLTQPELGIGIVVDRTRRIGVVAQMISGHALFLRPDDGALGGLPREQHEQHAGQHRALSGLQPGQAL